MSQRRYLVLLSFFITLLSCMEGLCLENAAPKTVKDLESTRLLRYPNVRDNQVVFCYGGDLWKAPLTGGTAIRLTAHDGLELFPHFSPDGHWIAFTGQYDGDEQVYIIPAEGGIPKQLTYYPVKGPNPPRRGYDHQVTGWTPDSKKVLFRSGRNSNNVDALTHLYTVSIEGGLPEQLPMPVAGAGVISPDGKKVVYSPLFRDFRHWKRYEGGWAQYLLIYDFNTKQYEKIPTTPRTDRDPLWLGKEVWFVSDRDGTMNLYRYNAEKKAVEQQTKHNDWDVRWATSDGKDKIVYELGGTLYLFDPNKKTEKAISIVVPHDGLAMRPSRINAANNLEAVDLGPKGKRAVASARGDIFTVPVEKGNVRNLTKTSSAHDRDAVWSPNGKWIAYISDSSHEDQLWLADQAGNKPAKQLTTTMKTRLDNPVWAPNNKAISFWNAENRLFVAELKQNKPDELPVLEKLQEVAKAKNGTPFQASWSPDGRYLAYVICTEFEYGVIYIWDKETKKSIRVTDEMFDNFSPVWDPKGDWLYFIGQREFYPQFSTIEWNFAGNRFHGLFALALRKDVKNIFMPESDEVEPENEKVTPDDKKADDKKADDKKADDKKADKTGKKEEVKDKGSKGKESSEKKDSKKEVPADKKPESKKIDFDGIQERVVRIPVSSENYSHLSAAGKYLFYLKEEIPAYGRPAPSQPQLKAFDLEKKKETTFLANVNGYTISPEGTKLLVQQGKSWKMYDTATAAGPDPKTYALDNLQVDSVPQEEWNEIFEEVWRRFRDYFYVRNMHGVNWKEIGDQYRALLPYVAHRNDLTYILTEMISELNIGHTYVDGGDFIVPNRTVCGLPGAEFELDKKANLYKIAKIYRGQNEETKYRSPLREPGIDVQVGDYLFEIDGEKLVGTDNPYRLLRDKLNSVTWKVGKKADGSDAHVITYKPIGNEADLRYLNFVQDRQERVNKASGGRIGYIHIPDMGANGSYEFIKWYYPQLRKEGLLIDVRNNGGGNISPWIIMRLNQKLLGTRFGSTRETPTTYPTIACNAYLACLINETSASDGDIFPYYFKKSGLGPLIGKRSWGGVVGISSRGPLLDGGSVMVPLSATNDEKGQYIIEGHGVDPDIVVEQEPNAVLAGHDPQLERGIGEIMKKIKAQPRTLPKRPADPVKSKKAVKKY